MNMDYWPCVIQVIPMPDYTVYIYFDDGTIRLYNAAPILKKGVFKRLLENNLFMESATVLNDTLAFTPDFSYSEDTCLDIDPFVLYDTCPIVDEPDLWG